MYLYENAIIDDINKLFTNSKVCALIADNLNEGLRRIAAKKDDKTTLPAIVLSGGDWVLGDANFYSLMHGSEFKQIIDTPEYPESMSKQINIIPFTPSYDMYIVAQSGRECDMLTREIIFHYFMQPTLTVKIPYGIDNIHTFNLSFNNNVRKSQNPAGLVYRTLSFSLQGAYLWHNNTFNVVRKIDTTVREEYETDV